MILLSFRQQKVCFKKQFCSQGWCLNFSKELGKLWREFSFSALLEQEKLFWLRLSPLIICFSTCQLQVWQANGKDNHKKWSEYNLFYSASLLNGQVSCSKRDIFWRDWLHSYKEIRKWARVNKESEDRAVGTDGWSWEFLAVCLCFGCDKQTLGSGLGLAKKTWEKNM